MRKGLLLVALLIVSQMNGVKAQSLFSAPDTVCINQPVFLDNIIPDASSYYWSFCSGYLSNPPQGNNLGNQPAFSTPSAIEVAKDGENYYAFVANKATNSLLRLNFGTSLSNIPATTNLGTLDNDIPFAPSSLDIVRDSATRNWFVFVSGGTNRQTSSVARINFGASLANNTPTIVNFGNTDTLLNAPTGIFVERQAGNYYGFVVNNADNKLIRLDFGTHLTLVPSKVDLGDTLVLFNPTDIEPVFEAGSWYLFITNSANNSITRVNLIESLVDTPQAINIGTIGGKLFAPSGLTFARDCGAQHLFVTNAVGNSITRIDMPSVPFGPYSGTIYSGVGSLAIPTGIAHIIREGDNLYTYVTNAADSTLSQIIFPQCGAATDSASIRPGGEVYEYTQPGTYNVSLIIDEGLPTMQVECKQITVLPLPQLTITKDTVICQGDSINLFVQAFGAQSYTWTPNYNITDTTAFAIKVWPEYGTTYHVVMPYANGCIVDSSITVDVHKNKADAGPDRYMFDGAKTMLGGPLTSTTPGHTFTWLPTPFINDINIPNPIVNPPYDFTYYLEVTDTFGCYDIDTVVIRVSCNNLNLPNAFVPESRNSVTNKFGVMNKQIIQLNHFRVFDRWGKLVFETMDATKEWDGTVNGEPAPAGVYIWEADGFCVAGQRLKRSGNVTLLR